MKLVRPTVTAATLALAIAGCTAFAQAPQQSAPQASEHYVRHSEWRKGAKISHTAWNRGQKVDFRSQHLDAPAAGAEWRRVDGNYILAESSTGLIAEVRVAHFAR